MDIAVGLLFDPRGKLLISRRPADRPHGGLWEFPGGKCHEGECIAAALKRELDEELGVDAQSVSPFLQIEHAYDDAHVRLHVMRVTRWAGEPRGREGQAVEWVAPAALGRREFPAADHAILAALRLPAACVITPDRDGYDETLFNRVRMLANAGMRLLQFRSRHAATAAGRRDARRLADICREYGCRVIVNGTPAAAERAHADGVHLSARRLMRLSARPFGPEQLVGASCHNQAELDQAARIGVDFVCLGPVRATATHPDVIPMGWREFERLAVPAGLPVYALGGLVPRDLGTARRHGAHGVAMISAVWSARDPAGLMRRLAAAPP